MKLTPNHAPRAAPRSLSIALFVALAATVLAPSAGSGQQWTTAEPEEVGMSSEVLARIPPTMQRLIDRDGTAGIMTLVSRRGEIVHWNAQGWRIRGEDPLEPDDIFRIYSMTKPITSVAAMILVDDGLLSLDAEL